MAPEQLDGDAGDHRADIFAFGCVLYEMLAGRKAFEGASAVTVIAAIMSSEPPPIAALQSAHPLLDHVLRRCLEKDRERRWQSIGDVTGELRWIADHPSRRAGRCRAAGATEPRRREWRCRSRFVLAAAAVAAAAIALRGRGAAPDLPTLRFEIATAPTDDPSMALSPDGTQIAFVANQNRVPDALGPLARRRREPRAAGHRRRQLSVLVAGRPHHRVLRRRQAEANRRRRWHAAGASPTRRTPAAARGTPTA